jgi:hypothetical protein
MLRFLPAALAAYELRYLFIHLAAFATAARGAGSSSVTLWALVVLAVGAGVCLRESARGLAASVPRPGWSLTFVGSWMLCSAALAAFLIAANLFNALPDFGHTQLLVHSGVAGMWPAGSAVLLVGLVLAASLRGVRWLLLELVGLRHRAVAARAPSLVLLVLRVEQRVAVAPLRAGWSDRGPPTAGLAAF